MLVGVNGSGKTTVLDAIALGLSQMVGMEPPDPSNLIRVGAPVTTATISLGLGVGGKPRSDFQVTCFPNRVQGRGSIPFDRRSPPVLCYYSVSRHAVDVTPGSTSPGRWVAQQALEERLRGSGTTFHQFFHWFREREDLENELRREDAAARDGQLEAVREAIERMLPGYSNPRVRRPRLDGSDYAKVPSLVITKDGQELPFNFLSEGERTTIALVADLARCAAIIHGGPDPLSAEGVVLIDEIDLHLHPQWQVHVLERLRAVFPNLQFIVTTHSPLVLGHVAVESVRFLKDWRTVPLTEPTLGRDPNSLLSEVFQVPLRPAHIQEALHEIARLLDEDNISEARVRLDLLAGTLGEQDSEVTRLRTYLEMLAS